MEVMRACQNEMQKFAVNMRNLERNYHDQPLVLEEVDLYCSVRIDTDRYVRALDFKPSVLDRNVKKADFLYATEPIIAFNKSFDKLGSYREGKSYPLISFGELGESDAAVGKGMEDLVRMLRTHQALITKHLWRSGLTR